MKEHTRNLVNAFGFLSMEEAELLMQTAEKLKDDAVVVNVGAGAGTSALAVIEQRPDLARSFFTIDARDDDNPFGGLLNELHAFQNAGMVDLLPNQIKSDSSAAALKWEHGNINLLIIDADHAYDAIIKDINTWTPSLADDGYIAFHDYGSNKWADVKMAVDEFIAANPEYEFVGQAGTMIIYRKGVKKVEAEKQELLEKKGKEKEAETKKDKTPTAKTTRAKQANAEKGS